jgi:hypothetical protein
MFVCCECCVVSGRGLCDGLITRPEESYRLWRVVVCDQETSKNENAKARYRAVKIQPQWVVTVGKQHIYIYVYRGADKSLSLPTSRCILFDCENISFDVSLVSYIYSTNIPPIMIINIYIVLIFLQL